ncbi:MAG: bifunctional 23S rRNA (guanine(2069)-N(7))-methyltransferase RlmK/23S rRNA (guanine(2445)-N(2))-methyltransferase RlmL [Coriobacteriales bacterium]|jgi:23S rRNA (guanine2445-N2)-methyltransferase / 23S rRNA (guanine2069-N7)-methyltransferase
MKTSRFDRDRTYELFASCAKGLEGIVAGELRELGVSRVRPLSSGVSFQADMAQICEALLWLRCASRVLVVLERGPARNADELYETCVNIPWEEHVSDGATIAIHAKGTNAKLRNTRFVEHRVKDALCDRLTEKTGARPNVDTRKPDFAVSVNIHESKATISLDASGAPMHRRGYREQGAQVEAPIKETLAAAILLAGDWPRIAAEGGSFVDPFCGSGTLAIEAALIAGDIAPGIFRGTWGIEGWKQFDQDALVAAVDAADARAESHQSPAGAIIAADIDPSAIALAQANARRAGVGGAIRFETSDIAHLAVDDLTPTGLIATNPPYGERLLSRSQLPSLLLALRGIVARQGAGWGLSLIVADPSVDSLLGARPTSVIDTFNGPLEATIRSYRAAGATPAPDAASGDTGASDSTADTSAGTLGMQAEQFANRLHKMAKHRGKWARRTGVTCYRVYDSDLPGFAMSVDLYQGAGAESGKRWAHVCEYAPPKTVDPELAGARLNAAVEAVRAEFDLNAGDVFLKRRIRSKGGSQYRETDGGPATESAGHVILENGHFFRVRFDAHLDTGLFLDGRDIRQLIGENSRGKDFLNLFAYTGSATVYAAAGGAASTHTVDLSNTYLAWARDNLALNHFDGPEHTFEQADVLPWVTETRHSPRRFDLIYVDPPTFSNSKRMRKRSWDVQRDHAELLIGVSRLLRENGTAIFCCNLRGFKPDVETLAKAHVGLADISKKTIPEDFARTGDIHHCYLVKHLR